MASAEDATRLEDTMPEGQESAAPAATSAVSGAGEVERQATGDGPGTPPSRDPQLASENGSSGGDTGGAAAASDEKPASEEEPAPEEGPDIAANPCPDGVANEAGTRCYLVSMTAASWQAARIACQDWGGDLVIMEDPAEDDFVAGLADDSVWVGGSDTEADGVFDWVDGQPMPRPPEGNWGANQPDSFPGEDCIEKRQEPSESWYDQPCFRELRYVCEKAPLPVAEP
jgi:hypothetical protein